METTIFFSQLWGPAMIAIGLGILINRDHYIKIYRNLENEKFATLVFGMIATAGGIAHIISHNTWGEFLEIVISLLGWTLFAKGIAFTMFPNFAAKKADWVVDTKLLPASATFLILLGLYLSFVGYLA